MECEGERGGEGEGEGEGDGVRVRVSGRVCCTFLYNELEVSTGYTQLSAAGTRLCIQQGCSN